MHKVATLDYKTDNIKSKSSRLIRLNINFYFDRLTKELDKANYLILPVFGQYGYSTSNLKINSLIEPILDLINPVINLIKNVNSI